MEYKADESSRKSKDNENILKTLYSGESFIKYLKLVGITVKPYILGMKY